MLYEDGVSLGLEVDGILVELEEEADEVVPGVGVDVQQEVAGMGRRGEGSAYEVMRLVTSKGTGLVLGYYYYYCCCCPTAPSPPLLLLQLILLLLPRTGG